VGTERFAKLQINQNNKILNIKDHCNEKMTVPIRPFNNRFKGLSNEMNAYVISLKGYKKTNGNATKIQCRYYA